MNPIYPYLQALADDKARYLPAAGGQGASWHLWRKSEVNAITLALASRRPLLVCGEPGSGKSQLARAASVALGWHWQGVTLHARSEVQDLLYQFDAVRRLADAQDRQVQDDAHYWQPQALWRALDWEGAKAYGPRRVQADRTQADSASTPPGHVVLIDEIDKAPQDVPNGLLDVLGERCFEVPGLGVRVSATGGGAGAANAAAAATANIAASIPNPPFFSDWPLIIITTNLERDLPDAFMRRCVVLSHASVDDEAYADFLLRYGKAHFASGQAGNPHSSSGQAGNPHSSSGQAGNPHSSSGQAGNPHSSSGQAGAPAMDVAIMRACAEQLQRDRQQARLVQVYAPGLAEYLDLLYALYELAPNDTDAQWQWLQRLNQYAWLKSGHDPAAPAAMQQHESGERRISAPGQGA